MLAPEDNYEEGMETDDDGYDDEGYYLANEDDYLEVFKDNNIRQKLDIEALDYECISVQETKDHLEAQVLSLAQQIKISPQLVKIILIQNNWDENKVLSSMLSNRDAFLEEMGIKPQGKELKGSANFIESDKVSPLADLSYKVVQNQVPSSLASNLSNQIECEICLENFFMNDQKALLCEHYFCDTCWRCYIECELENGHAAQIECMSTKCHLRVPESLIEQLITDSVMLDKYRTMFFKDCIESHPNLRFCVNSECKQIIKAKECKLKKVTCKTCNSSYCFKCGCEYHAPADCKILKLWTIKCADDSETANYISANTKDCPKCNSSIEKNGGCNHMMCYKCRHNFCWVCLGAWDQHGATYYNCSKFVETANAKTEVERARQSLRKYLFYYERWDNHQKSLRLEKATLERIKDKIEKKLMANSGTWIDWQYLIKAAALLAKCRYTLQYTYPAAFYMEAGSSKDLFEYQQAQLEAEIEALSWKVENAETTDRGDLENQISIVEKRRVTLLEEFFKNQ